MGYWTDKVVMITGASSGIGRGLALEIASRGAHLGLLARRRRTAERRSSRCDEKRNVAVALRRMFAMLKAMKEAADRFREELGPIDVLIANAGIGTADHATRLTPEHART